MFIIPQLICIGIGQDCLYYWLLFDWVGPAKLGPHVLLVAIGFGVQATINSHGDWLGMPVLLVASWPMTIASNQMGKTIQNCEPTRIV
jgi:hypothetical protein